MIGLKGPENVFRLFTAITTFCPKQIGSFVYVSRARI
jgi:hypothetical protein